MKGHRQALKQSVETAKTPKKELEGRLRVADREMGGRDIVKTSFCATRTEFDMLAMLNKRAMRCELVARQSTLLRAGLHALERMSDGEFKKLLQSVEDLEATRARRRSKKG